MTPGTDAARHVLEIQKPTRVIAVAGGAGFIGSHLCERLVKQGHAVFCLDNFSTGRRSNIGSLGDFPRFKIVEHDVTDPLPAHLPKLDEIYNLACPASPTHYQADPVKTAMTCARGAMRMLEVTARFGAKLLHASTSEVYGDPLVHPQNESYFGNVNPVGPRSCYDEGKRFAETLVTDFGRQSGLDLKIVRIFNTYGPRMRLDDGRVVSNFIVQALQGDNITVFGDGSQTRSFCYVDDLVDGMIRLMHSDVGGPINMGNPSECTIGRLAETVLALTHSRSELVYQPLPIDDPRRRQPDIARARKFLRWEPTVGLQEGLTKTIDYFVQQLA